MAGGSSRRLSQDRSNTVGRAAQWFRCAWSEGSVEPRVATRGPPRGVVVDSNRPEGVSRQLCVFLDQGDLEGVMSLYEADAVFVDLDGRYVGNAAIRTAHERFLDAGLALTLKESASIESGDLALVHWSWSVSRSDGSTAEGSSAEVLRRQPDGTWKFVIDNSDGSAVLGLL
jgi:ketosteroid isomerase-like protein